MADEKEAKSDEAVEKKPEQSPTRGLSVTTDGTLVSVHAQTCSNLELRMIGQVLLRLAEDRERAAMESFKSGPAKVPATPAT